MRPSVNETRDGVAHLITLFRSRFLNREDRVAVLAPWGKPCPAEVNGNLEALLRGHLQGVPAPSTRVSCTTRRGRVELEGTFRIGAYSPAPDGTTRWLCIDFDGGTHSSALADSTAAVLATRRTCLEYGLQVYVERSGGGKGWHLWVFFDAPIAAGVARALGLAVIPHDLPLAAGGMADPVLGSGIEVFPKSLRIRKNGYGSAVWLPLWSGATGDACRFFVENQEGALAPTTVTEITTVSEETVRALLDRLGIRPDDDATTRKPTDAPRVPKEWRARALSALPLESVYGDLLTGRTSGNGWLECRDPDSPSGDNSPSAGVADGTGDTERGSFHSFRTGRTVPVFDFLIEAGKARDFEQAMELVAELSKIPLPEVQSLPMIRTDKRQLRDLVQEGWAAIHDSNSGPEVFQRTGSLVRLVPSGDGPRIDLLNQDAVYGRLARSATWWRVSEEGPVDTHPPRDVARDMLVYLDSDLPHLDRLCFAPVFDSKGTLLARVGYHPELHTWLHLPEGVAMATVSDAPTTDDVRLARRLLLDDLLVDFPFVTDSDRAHAVAALLLQPVRNLISGCTPIHDIESPTPGSGKGLLADIVSILAMGRVCQATTIARDEDESRKKITSILSRGQAVILIDNVRGVLESSSLASAITAEIWSDRILGQSRMIDVPNRATWIVTANNPRLSLEIARRCVRIRLDPKVDRPWRRTGFKHPNLREWTVAQRFDLIWAICVLVRAWITQGRPSADQSIGSFESYSSVVGGILKVAGIDGFLEDAEQLYDQADIEGREWRPFIAAWWEEFGPRWVSPGELHRLALDKDLLGYVLGDKGERSQKIRLGKALQGMRDRQFGRHRIVTEPDTNSGAARYRLVKANDPVGSP